MLAIDGDNVRNEQGPAVAARPAPAFVQLPGKPRSWSWRREIALVIVLVLAVVLAMAFWGGGVRMLLKDWLASLAFCSYLGVRMRNQRRYFVADQRWRQENSARIAEWAADARAAQVRGLQAIEKQFRENTALTAEYRRRLSDLAVERAWVICSGAVSPPDELTDYFEPRIVTPTRSIWRMLWPVPVALAWLALGLNNSFGLVPIVQGVSTRGLGYFVVLGIIGSIAWSIGAGLMPQYIRFAPGLIEVLQFGLLRRTPEITPYPIEPGTVLWVERVWPAVRVTLIRDAQSETVELQNMRRPEEVERWLWDAVLSSAPTPPVPQDGLVG